MTERNPGALPPEEEAAWARIVAGYGEEAARPGGAAGHGAGHGPGGDSDSGAGGSGTGGSGAGGSGTGGSGTGGSGADGSAEGAVKGREGGGSSGSAGVSDGAGPASSGDGGSGDGTGADEVRSFTVYAAGSGPRDWVAPEGQDAGDDGEDDGEGHYVPPEPPPLPETDVTTKFAWIAVLGGPLLMLCTVLLQQPMRWWIVTLGVGGFLGGFGTLVARMRDDEDDDDDPGRGAVV